MNKFLLTLFATLGLSAAASAQVSYGVKAGLNVPTIKFSSGNMSYKTDASTSFYVGGFVDATIAPNLSIQPGISFEGKGGTFASDALDFGGNGTDAKLTLLYLEVPVNLVYYIPTGESGDFFLGAGPYAGFGVRAIGKADGESDSGSFDEAGLKSFDAGANFLLGYRLQNGLLFNAGYGLGLANASQDNEVSIENNVWKFGLGFQF